MTIKEVCEKFDITPDTLRYYERVGVIPEVRRTAGGIRDYSESDVNWVANAMCFRSAGMPIEMLVEYVRLAQAGDGTLQARCDLLKQARDQIAEVRRKYDDALAKMDHKIAIYEKAVQTGKLDWCDPCCTGKDSPAQG